MSLTFGDVADAYFSYRAGLVEQGRSTPIELESDRQRYVRHLEPTFGAMSFIEIGSDVVEDWIDTQLGDEVPTVSVRVRFRLLRTVMTYGQVEMRLRSDNPCESLINVVPSRSTGP
jgi:hypothetical protein